jgi:large subunit ribosomal protein L23
MSTGDILLIPYVTEKTSKLMEHNQYVFLLLKDETKISIKNYFQNKYEVKVDSVNMLKRFSKTVNRGRIKGTKRAYKKVIVKISSSSNKEKIEQLF